MRKRLLPLLTLIVLAIPAATAHTSVFSTDGKYRVVIGQLAEPVVTYQKSGLDVCFQHNDTARTPLSVNPGAFVVTLRAPDGDELSHGLQAQHGRLGCFTFEHPYVPTQAGQYVVDLVGTINRTSMSFRNVNAGGPVDDLAIVAFPDTGVRSLAALRDDVAALTSRLAAAEEESDALAAQVAALQAELDKPEKKGSPLSPALVVVALLAAVALLRRRR